MVNQQENPSDKHADITLSNGNLTASQSATNQRAHGCRPLHLRSMAGHLRSIATSPPVG
jgi:hypothetical protein